MLTWVEPVGALLVLTGGLIYLHKTLYHFTVVERGRLYRSGVLGRAAFLWVWRRYGIRTVVNLVSKPECRRGTWYEREKRFCREKGIEMVHLAMPPGGIPDTQQIRRFLRVVLSEERLPVLVHCKQGVARTNMMVAVYLKERFGLPNTEILRRLPWFSHLVEKPRYARMKAFILGYPGMGPRRSDDVKTL